MAEITTIKVSRETRARIERLKIHPSQPTGEIVALAVDALEVARDTGAEANTPQNGSVAH